MKPILWNTPKRLCHEFYRLRPASRFAAGRVHHGKRQHVRDLGWGSLRTAEGGPLTCIKPLTPNTGGCAPCPRIPEAAAETVSGRFAAGTAKIGPCYSALLAATGRFPYNGG